MKGTFGTISALAGGAMMLAACNETAMIEVAQEDAARGSPGEVCVAAVSEQVEEVDVTVLEVETPTTDTLVSVVTVVVGVERTPWRCTVTGDGVVTEIVAVSG